MKVLSIDNAAREMAERLCVKYKWGGPGLRSGYVVPALYGVPRGGIAAALAVSRYLPGAVIVDDPRRSNSRSWSCRILATMRLRMRQRLCC